MTDFLLELRSEEVPARMQAGARAELEKLFRKEMEAAGVALGGITVWSTPRRLALIARDLPEATAAVSEELKGPKVGASPQALEGFLRKTGLTQDELTERDGIYFAFTEKPGRATREVLAEAIPAIVRAFPWPKSMRWGAASLSTESLRWVRPLSGIVALLGEELVECAVGDVASGFATKGHRFHCPGEITIGSASDYQEKLRACHVIVDHAERQDLIRSKAREAAEAAGLTLVADEGLVIENAGLTEWPVPLLGRFDADFLEVPPEVIQLTARTNQKYFVCEADGKLANAFVCTANIAAADGGLAIVAGNRKVLAARLSDARFFWEQDRKVSLAEQARKLERITFHEKLGTVADKVERVAKLARWLLEEGIVTSSPSGEGTHAVGEGLARVLPSSRADANADLTPGANKGSEYSPEPLHHPTDGPPLLKERMADLAEQAARLCKADLVTEMVGEFPELQGLMGGYYARAEGLPDAVADAIRDHYKPVGQGDEVPNAPVTVAVSLADKLDTLVGFFEADLRPTGSKDPFALRRAGIGIIQLLIKNGIRTSLTPVIREALRDKSRLDEQMSLRAAGLFTFLADRLKVQQREAGVRHDIVDAVFGHAKQFDLVRTVSLVGILQAFIETADGSDLLAGYRRAASILQKEGFVGGAQKALSYTPEPAEKALIDALDAAAPLAAKAVAEERFADAMAALASLRAAVDAFFESVTVNDADRAKRESRLALLGGFRDAVHAVADFSKIEG